MKHKFLLAAGACLLSLPLHADDWSKTYNISGKPELRVETSDADIQVDTWDQNRIDVHVTTSRYKIGEGGIQIYEHQTGDAVELDVRFPHHVVTFSIGTHERRVVIDVHMPREGLVNLHTGDGSIRLSHLKGEMNVESGDGRQEIDAVDGNLRAHAGDGRINAAGRFDSLELSTGDGRIEARALPGSKAAGTWNLRAGDGSISLAVPDSLAADVDLHTSDGHLTLDVPVQVEGRMGGKDIHGKLNGGGNLLLIRTGDGSITLGRS